MYMIMPTIKLDTKYNISELKTYFEFSTLFDSTICLSIAVTILMPTNGASTETVAFIIAKIPYCSEVRCLVISGRSRNVIPEFRKEEVV